MHCSRLRTATRTTSPSQALAVSARRPRYTWVRRSLPETEKLLDRLKIETGTFRFNMLPVVHTATQGETVEDIAVALLDRLRQTLVTKGYQTTEVHWELDLKLFKVGGSAGPAVVPQIVDQLVDRIVAVMKSVKKGPEINGLILFVDEVDRVTRIPPHLSSAEDVATGFGSFFKVLSEKLVTRDLKRVGLCVCGVEGFLQELRDEHPSVERVFRDVPIPLLRPEQSAAIITQALNTTTTTISRSALERIIQLSGGYPEPIHLIGSEAFKADTDNEIDDIDLDLAIDRVVRSIRRNYLKDLVARAGAGRHQEILTVMASLDGPVRAVSDVGDAMNLQPYQFGSNITRLTRAGVITRVSKGRYRFTEPLLEVYIQRVGLGQASAEDADTESELEA